MKYKHTISKLTLLTVLLMIFAACNTANVDTNRDKGGENLVNEQKEAASDYVNPYKNQELTIGIDTLLQLLEQGISNDTLYIYNFWATWCKPCVEEMPYFRKVAAENANKKLKLVFVSLDFPEQIDSRLMPFLEKNKLTEPVYVLDAGNPNDWIDLISKKWTGAIPATMFVGKLKVEDKADKYFYEQEFSYEELNDLVNTFNL